MTPEELIATEAYTWRVVYVDDTVLEEASVCTQHEAAQIDPGGPHVFACIDRSRAVSIELANTNLKVACPTPDVEPVFFRRRAVEAFMGELEDGSIGEIAPRQPRTDLFQTWIGWRRFRDGQTEPCAESFLCILSDGRIELRPDSSQRGWFD